MMASACGHVARPAPQQGSSRASSAGDDEWMLPFWAKRGIDRQVLMKSERFQSPARRPVTHLGGGGRGVGAAEGRGNRQPRGPACPLA